MQRGLTRWVGLVGLVAAAAGCTEPEDRACQRDEHCKPGQVCQASRCVTSDAGGQADGDVDGQAAMDAANDARPADMARADQGRVDMATPDMARQDMVTPDMASPDMNRPDMNRPDMAPDMSPDMAIPPDLGPPPCELGSAALPCRLGPNPQ